MIYEQYLGVIDRKADTICAVSDGLWDHAELPFQEYESMEILAGALEKEGFTVTRGVADGQLRRRITELFGCPVAQTLGMRTEGIVAFMCPEGHLHIAAENCFAEILDPQTWSPLPPNKPGLLAVTDLVGTAMPHLRVVLNYMAELSDEPCPCGRTLPVLKHLRATAPGI